MNKIRIPFQRKNILITGAAGFIGSALVQRVCRENPSARVVGFDSVNDYYDVSLKEYRLKELSGLPNFTFIKGNLANKKLIDDIFAKYKPEIVVNLAAQAGVRYSITNPDAYIEANLIGFYVPPDRRHRQAGHRSRAAGHGSGGAVRVDAGRPDGKGHGLC